jgi:hypothetical protein
MFDNTAAVVADLHSRGKKVICYIDVGSWENYRSDASKFPASLLGAKYSGFPNERWLDIRSTKYHHLTTGANSDHSLPTGES